MLSRGVSMTKTILALLFESNIQGDLGSRLIFGRPSASKRHYGNLQGTANQGELNGRRPWGTADF
jgi:hypothetical protein